MTDGDAPDGDVDGAPDPRAFCIPTVEELDAIRTELGLSQKELSRRAGLEPGRFNTVLRRDMDPQTETMRAFLDVLHAAADRSPEDVTRTGPKPERSTLIDDEDDGDDGGLSSDEAARRYDRLYARLQHGPPDAVGEDPRPPEVSKDA